MLNHSNKKGLEKLTLGFLFLFSFVLGIKKLIEPDMWWYLLTGEWIVKNGSVPTVDVFSYTFPRIEWINTKWLYEVIVYGFNAIGGPGFIAIWQSLLNVGLVLMLWCIYKQLAAWSKVKMSPAWFAFLSVFILCSIEYRLTSRPESISFLMVLLMLWVYLKARLKPRFIFWLIPIQLLWTNLHEAFGIGYVLMTVFVVAELIEKQWVQKDKNIKWLLISTLLAFLSVGINPRGTQMYLHPLEIYRQLGANKFTAELFSIERNYYWEMWQTYSFITVFIGLIVLAVFVLFRQGNVKQQIKTYGTQYLAYGTLLALFAYLGTTAHRNLPFFLLLATPVILVLVQRVVKKLSFEPQLNLVVLLFIPAAYFAVVSDFYYEQTNARFSFGLDVDESYHPVGGALELENLDYSAPHFSDYLTSSYMMWHLRDGYKSFIDLRDLDVFPKAFFNDVIVSNHVPSYFDFFEEKYQVEYAYLQRHYYAQLAQYLYDREDWNLKYADEVCYVFKKEKHQSKDVYQSIQAYPTTPICDAINRLFYPFYSNAKEKLDNTNEQAAKLYSDIQAFDLALHKVHAEISQTESANAYVLLGDLYTQMAIQDTTGKSDSLSNRALIALNKAKSIDSKNPAVFDKIGSLFMAQNRPADALGMFKQSVKYEKDNPEVYNKMADCQQMLLSQNVNAAVKLRENWVKYMKLAIEYDSENLIYVYKLGVSFCLNNECDKAIPYLNQLGPLPELSDEQNEEILKCQKKCGAHQNKELKTKHHHHDHDHSGHDHAH